MDLKRELCIGVSILLAINIVQGAIAPTQFEVGDEVGWTLPILANVNYTSWASDHKYHVGDTLLFTYVGEIHSVVQVSSQEEYNSCNSNNAIATHGNGKTAITLTKPGPYFFICGIPGHCSLGQKFTLIAVPTSQTSVDPSGDHNSMDSFGSHTPVAQPPGSSGAKQLVSWVMLLGAVSLCSSFLI